MTQTQQSKSIDLSYGNLSKIAPSPSFCFSSLSVLIRNCTRELLATSTIVLSLRRLGAGKRLPMITYIGELNEQEIDIKYSDLC